MSANPLFSVFNGQLNQIQTFLDEATDETVEEFQSRLGIIVVVKKKHDDLITAELSKPRVSPQNLSALTQRQLNFDEKYCTIDAAIKRKIKELEIANAPAPPQPVVQIQPVQNVANIPAAPVEAVSFDILEQKLQSIEDIFSTQKDRITLSTCEHVIHNLEQIDREFFHLPQVIVQPEANAQVDDEENPVVNPEIEMRTGFRHRLNLQIINFNEIKDNILTATVLTPQTEILQPIFPQVQQNTHRQKHIKIKAIQPDPFDGNPAGWATFRDLYLNLIHENDELSNVAKFQWLKTLITDKLSPAHDLIPSDCGYDAAWKAVHDYYDNPNDAIRCHLDSILQTKIIFDENYEKLQKLINETQVNFASLEKIAKEQGLDLSEVIVGHIILKRLDIKSQDQWNMLNKNNVTQWSNLYSFLTERAKTLRNRPNFASQKSSFNNNKQQVTHKFTKSNTAESSKSKNVKDLKCALCNENHRINRCPQFTNMTISSRESKVNALNLCENCLSKFHSVDSCTSKRSCRHCNKNHHSLLCSADKVTTCNNASKVPFLQGLLSTVIVYIHTPDGNSHPVRAFIDSGSEASYIRKCIVDSLHLSKTKCDITCSGIGESQILITHLHEAQISNKEKSNIYNLNLLIIPSINGISPSKKVSKEIYKIPENLKLADPSFDKPGPIDILIGNEIARRIETDGRIHLENGITLFNTVFGWALAGSIPQSPKDVPVRCNVSTNVTTLQHIRESIEKFYKIEDYRNDKRIFTDEETYCEEFFQRTYKRLPDGRFQITIPFKATLSKLANNANQALVMFNDTEKRLQRPANAQLRDDYVEFLREYEKLGHMTTVDSFQDHKSPAYYLPHHPVFKPSSTTTSTRVVFNGSFKTSSGYSLNDVQYVGPPIQSDSFDLLIRFRQHPIVIKADISKFYRQVNVAPEQRKFQRIWWRESPSDKLKIKELCTVTYGTGSASFQSTRCLKQLALDCREKYPETSKIIEEDFFVDDCLSGAPNIETAVLRYKELTEITDSAKFPLRKFLSNSKEFIEQIPIEHREKKKNENSSEQSDSTSFTALGVKWCTVDDKIGFDIDPITVDKVTKRTILSAIAKPMALDPTGLVGPVTLKLKLFMRTVHQLNIPWDKNLPEPEREEWLSLVTNIPLVNNILIPRLIVNPSAKKVEIHCFCDASMDAHGAAIYISSRSSNAKNEVHLVASKSRVAAKGVPLPRLELCGAVVAAHLIRSIVSNTLLKVEKIYCWSDSMIALYWITECPSKLPIFIANRVHEIKRMPLDISWRHIRGADNPADLISRGMNPEELAESSLWWHGPNFLQKPESEWPQSLLEFNTSNPDHENESLKYQCMTTITKPDTSNFIVDLMEKSSSLLLVKRKIAYIRRFVQFIKSKYSKDKQTPNTNPIDVVELQFAEKLIARAYQMIYMPIEYKQLKNGKQIPSTSKYASLSPIWDEKYQLIRVGGRLNRSSLSYNERHQILLPKSHHTHVIIRDYHEYALHGGMRQTLSYINYRYWPVNAKSQVKFVLHKCITCHRKNPQLSQQIMAPLPIDRIKACSAFYVTGVDFAGPLQMKVSKLRHAKMSDVYICVFVCFATKAIHLEIVTSADTKHFQLALSRFISRRGIPSTIWSDHGRNFIGAANDMKKVVEMIKMSPTLSTFLQQREIQWKNIPPRAPSFGGLWEAAVKSMKQLLYKVMGQSHLTYEELSTVCCRIEAILNSRPLTELNDDPNDDTVLTPSHLLIGKELLAPPEHEYDEEIDLSRLQRYDRVIAYQQHFWRRWSKEYLRLLQQRKKNYFTQPNLKQGQLVLVHTDNVPSMSWPLARIVSVHPDEDGKVRVVSIKTASRPTPFKRPIVKLSPLPIEADDP